MNTLIIRKNPRKYTVEALMILEQSDCASYREAMQHNANARTKEMQIT